MKKLFTLLALGSVTVASADQYNQPYGNGAVSPSYNSGWSYYQDQPNNDNYYQQNPRQNSQGYYQRNNEYDYQQQGQSYNGDQQKNYNNSYSSQNSDNQRTTSDQEINKKIHDTLSSGWFSKGFQNVSFDVNNGIVNLRGSVDTLENKNKVEESVRKIEGVRYVNNQINIAKEKSDTYSESQLQDSEKKYPQDFASNSEDRQLNAKIRDKLSNGWFSKGYETIVIRTTNGVVVISGSVDKPEDIKKINDEIKNIEGAKSINNQLTVKNR